MRHGATVAETTRAGRRRPDKGAGRLLDLILNAITALGYPGIALLMVVENVFPPVPSELIMPLAGFLAVQGEFSFVGVTLAGTLGSVLL